MPGTNGQGREARRLALTEDRAAQLRLLEPQGIAGLAYRAEFVAREQESALVERLALLAFKPFEFRGYLGRRRVISFGVRYDFSDGKMHDAPEIPAFLLPLRGLAAKFAGIEPAALRQALVTEYQPGAGIGWHRDRPGFDDVIGVSLLSPCRFRLRRRQRAGWRRQDLVLEPRSAYLLRGEVRWAWEHSIPPADNLRYSVTFRSLKRGG
jgi:alkylated DNA repair dioxygenase AlkB